MPFCSQREAKQFLAAKIIDEAAREGSPLSDTDQRMLFFSEQEPDTLEGIPEDVLCDVDEDYEANVTRLLRNTYSRDKHDPGLKQTYKEAFKS
jgi:hypothetical protein